MARSVRFSVAYAGSLALLSALLSGACGGSDFQSSTSAAGAGGSGGSAGKSGTGGQGGTSGAAGLGGVSGVAAVAGLAGVGGGDVPCTMGSTDCPSGYSCGCGGPGGLPNCTCHKQCTEDKDCPAANPMCGCNASDPAPRICVNSCFCLCGG